MSVLSQPVVSLSEIVKDDTAMTGTGSQDNTGTTVGFRGDPNTMLNIGSAHQKNSANDSLANQTLVWVSIGLVSFGGFSSLGWLFLFGLSLSVFMDVLEEVREE